MRLKPREKPEVNKWWMCDEGRYAYKSIDHGRLKQLKGAGAGWKQALETVGALLKKAAPDKWAVLASPQNTNEELYLVKRLFADTLKWKHGAFQAPGQEGYEDDFLLKKDKNPNTSGASQILTAEAKQDMTAVIEKAKRGELEGLFIFNHDLAKIFGAETLKTVRQKVKTIVYQGTNQNPTSDAADIVLPAVTYAEKDGTFTNFEGRVQRIRKAVEPFAGTLPDWDILLNLCGQLGLSLKHLRPEHIFDDLAKEHAAFSGMNYKKIGSQGLVWSKK